MFLNLILRVLPFYLREPLVIGICLTMAGACFYWFVQVGGLGRGGFGLLFLAIAALRGFLFRKEWIAHQAAKASKAANAAV